MTPLRAAPFIGFIPVADLDAARAFYEGTLGLKVSDASEGAVVLDAGGTMLRLTVAPRLSPQSFTVAGWLVSDVTQTIAALREMNVELERYAELDQDAAGVWTAPNGDQVAWFRDPDGNVLSVTQFAQGLVDDYWR